jgi:hypothetical protein
MQVKKSNKNIHYRSLFFVIILLVGLFGSSILLFLPKPIYANPAYEDFTDYEELDDNEHIDLVGTNHVDHYAIRSEDAYLYKDKGIDYFANFEHLVDVRSDFAVTSSVGYVWMLANDVDDAKGLMDADETFIWLDTYKTSTIRYLRLVEGYGGSSYVDQVAVYANTWYNLRIKKVGTTFTCRIWKDDSTSRDNDDTGAESYVTELSLTLHADHNFQYIYACNTYNSGNSYYCNNDIENLDLQEPIEHITRTHTFLSTETSDGSVTEWEVVQIIIDPTTTITETSVAYTTITDTCTTVSVTFSTLTTTCETSTKTDKTTTTTCTTSVETVKTTTSTGTTSTSTSETSTTTCETATETDETSTTTSTTSTSTDDTTTTTGTTSTSTSETTTSTDTTATICDTSVYSSTSSTVTCDTSVISSTFTTTTTSSETSTISETTQIVSITCESTTMTHYITSTYQDTATSTATSYVDTVTESITTAYSTVEYATEEDVTTNIFLGIFIIIAVGVGLYYGLVKH